MEVPASSRRSFCGTISPYKSHSSVRNSEKYHDVTKSSLLSVVWNIDRMNLQVQNMCQFLFSVAMR